MSKLIDLIDNTKTDKNTAHSYIETYENLFSEKKYNKNNVLEIGIGAPKENKDNGGSIKLWYDYFINSTIYGLDIIDINQINESIINKDRIKLFTSINAYDKNFIEQNLKDIKFDIIIDDGPHTLESVVFAVKNYLPLLNVNGILVIEDVQTYEWINILRDSTPYEFKNYIQIYDLRYIKNRWDDLLFVIKK